MGKTLKWALLSLAVLIALMATALFLWARPEDKPLGAQLVGCRPEAMGEAAAIVEAMGYDWLDLNLGCPVPKIAGQGAGSALLADPEKCKSIFTAVVKNVKKIPVTVKMRLGVSDGTGQEADAVATDADTWTKYIPGQSDGAISDANTVSSGSEPDTAHIDWEKNGGEWRDARPNRRRWRAPKEAGVYTIILTANDGAPNVAIGSRDDPPVIRTIEIRVKGECGEKPLQADQECCDTILPVAPFYPEKQCCELAGILDKNTIRRLSDCPHRRPRPGFVPTGEDCTMSPENPNVCAPSFTPACVRHDMCYRTCNKAKQVCDNNFRRDMVGICQGVSDRFCRAECMGNANLYFSVVNSAPSVFFYDNGQKEGCVCC